MSKPGPRPTPTGVLQLRGSWRAAGRSDAAVKPSRPACPRWLGAEARKKWKQLVPELAKLGILTTVDREALARYCDTWALWRRMREHVEKYGVSYPLRTDDGEVKCFQQFPEVGAMHKLALLLGRLEAEFGLTPSARTRIDIEKPAEVPAVRTRVRRA